MSCCEAVVASLARFTQRKEVAAAAALVGLGLAVAKILSVRNACNFAKKRKEQKRDVVYLFGGMRCSFSPNASVFVMKVEAFLRAAKIPYVLDAGSPGQSPSGAIPFADYNGECICDSQQIIEAISKKRNVNLNADLSAEQQAVGLAVQRMLEEHLRLGFSRTAVVDNPAVFRCVFREFGMPSFVAWFIVNSYRKRTVNTLNLHGFGDLSDARYHEECIRDVKAFETILGTKPFLFGNKISTFDISAYTFLAILSVDLKLNNSPLVDYVKASPVVQGYLKRFNDVVFPDLARLKVTGTKLPQEFLTYPIA